MKYREVILSKLIDRYENSDQSYDSMAKKRAISLLVEKDSIFKNYWVANHYLYRPEIECDVEALEREGFIVVVYKNDLLQKVTLNIDKVDEIYIALRREPKRDKGLKELSFICDELQKSNITFVAGTFLSKMQKLLEQHETHERYFKGLEDLSLMISIIKAIEENAEEILLRNFSKKYFKDSKLLEKYASKILSLFNEFDVVQYSSFAELCTKHYIIKNSGYAYVKKGLLLKINNQTIDLDALATDFALSDNAIDVMDILQVKASKVYTIENLTTYHYFSDKDAVVIYLGGYHNRIKCKFLKKIHGAKSSVQWFHIGDIDWGGFEIFMHLTTSTGIEFQPYLMGIEELERYEAECLPLTQNDRIRLEKLLSDTRASCFHSTIEYMLKKGYKLEQESLIFE